MQEQVDSTLTSGTAEASAEPRRRAAFSADDDVLDPMLSRRQTQIESGLSGSTMQRMQAKGLFPKFIQLSPGRSGMPRSWVRKWRDERAAATEMPGRRPLLESPNKKRSRR